jgi:hypothetical protein
MSKGIIELGIILGFMMASGLVLILSRFGIRYRLTFSHLLVTWLGFRVRQIPLWEIEAITTKPVFWAEPWNNTLFMGNRKVILRRRTGFIRHLIISPQYPFVFLAELGRAQKFLQGTPPQPVPSRLDTERVILAKEYDSSDQESLEPIQG